MKEKSKKSSFVGFTLVELVIVIAVIAILAAVLIPTFVGVIDRANDSADLQLVTNMNTVAVTLSDSDLATAENIRKALADNGLTEIATKNSKNIITYNINDKKFERINIKGSTLIPTVSAEELYYTSSPFSAEEILTGRLVVSTKGNGLSEALYALHNIKSTDTASSLNAALQKIENDSMRTTVAKLLQSSVFINDDGKAVRLTIDGDTITGITNGASGATRVVFNESLHTFNISELDDAPDGLGIIIPNGITSVNGDAIACKAMISGNIDALDETLRLSENVNLVDSIQQAKDVVASNQTGLLVKDEYLVVKTKTGDDNRYYSEAELSKAINDAAASYNLSGRERSVTIAEPASNSSITIAQGTTLTVLKGVILDIPFDCQGDTYRTGSIGGGREGYTASTRLATDADAKFELAVEGTLEVYGKLQVGGVISHTDQWYQGHTSGYHGRITNNGTINIYDGGVMDIWGFVKGNGTVNAQAGGTIFEPFVVTDFSGGMNSATLYGNYQSPFMRYSMLNIQCPLKVEHGALLYAHCNLYASYNYNTTDQVVIGYRSRDSIEDELTKGLINLDEGAYAECIYSAAPLIHDMSKANDKEENSYNNLTNDCIGKTSVTIHGNAATGALSLLGIVTTSNVLFPIPYNFEFTFEAGKFDVYNSYVLLPGSKVTVKSDATFNITKGAEFYVMDEMFVKSDMSQKIYPSSTLLQANGISKSATFIVNGKFTVENGDADHITKVGGIVNTEHEDAEVILGNVDDDTDDEFIDVSGSFDIGAVGNYAANMSTYLYPLRLYDEAGEDETDPWFKAAPDCRYTATSASDSKELTVAKENIRYLVMVPTADVTNGTKKYDYVTHPTTVNFGQKAGDPVYYAWETSSADVTVTAKGKWTQNAAQSSKQIQKYNEEIQEFENLSVDGMNASAALNKFNEVVDMLKKLDTLSASVRKSVKEAANSVGNSGLVELYKKAYPLVFAGSEQEAMDLALEAIAAEKTYKALPGFIRDYLGSAYGTVSEIRTSNPVLFSYKIENGSDGVGMGENNEFAPKLNELMTENPNKKIEIVLFDDVLMTRHATDTKKSVIVPSGTELYIDLNGRQIAGDVHNSFTLFTVQQGASLTLDNTSEDPATLAGASSGAITSATNKGIESNGNLSINNITINNVYDAVIARMGENISFTDLDIDARFTALNLGYSSGTNGVVHVTEISNVSLMIHDSTNGRGIYIKPEGSATIDLMYNVTTKANFHGVPLFIDGKNNMPATINEIRNCSFVTYLESSSSKRNSALLFYYGNVTIGKIVDSNFTGIDHAFEYSSSDISQTKPVIIEKIENCSFTIDANSTNVAIDLVDGASINGFSGGTIIAPKGKAFKLANGSALKISSGYFKAASLNDVFDATDYAFAEYIKDDQLQSDVDNWYLEQISAGDTTNEYAGFYTIALGGKYVYLCDDEGVPYAVWRGKSFADADRVGLDELSRVKNGRTFDHWAKIDGVDSGFDTLPKVNFGTLAAGSKLVAVYRLSDKKVAQIGSKQYSLIQDAIDAANNGDTIILLSDVKEDNITFNKDIDLTLNLADHSITTFSAVQVNSSVSKTNYTSEPYILKVASGNLTITGGTSGKLTSSLWQTVCVTGGTLNLDHVRVGVSSTKSGVTMTKPGGAIVVSTLENSSATINLGKDVVVEALTNNRSSGAILLYDCKGNVNINMSDNSQLLSDSNGIFGDYSTNDNNITTSIAMKDTSAIIAYATTGIEMRGIEVNTNMNLTTEEGTMIIAYSTSTSTIYKGYAIAPHFKLNMNLSGYLYGKTQAINTITNDKAGISITLTNVYLGNSKTNAITSVPEDKRNDSTYYSNKADLEVLPASLIDGKNGNIVQSDSNGTITTKDSVSFPISRGTQTLPKMTFVCLNVNYTYAA